MPGLAYEKVCLLCKGNVGKSFRTSYFPFFLHFNVQTFAH